MDGKLSASIEQRVDEMKTKAGRGRHFGELLPEIEINLDDSTDGIIKANASEGGQAPISKYRCRRMMSSPHTSTKLWMPLFDKFFCRIRDNSSSDSSSEDMFSRKTATSDAKEGSKGSDAALNAFISVCAVPCSLTRKLELTDWIRTLCLAL